MPALLPPCTLLTCPTRLCRTCIFFSRSLSTYKCPEIASAGPHAGAALHKLPRLIIAHTHTHLLMIPCTSCLMNKDKDKDKDSHLLPTCTPETAEPAPTADASQASPRVLVPACPLLPQVHLTRRLASRCKESSNLPTSLLCKAVPCSRNMGAPPSS
jgi:hypothetical protein